MMAPIATNCWTDCAGAAQNRSQECERRRPPRRANATEGAGRTRPLRYFSEVAKVAEVVEDITSRYLALVDGVLPGRIEGLYLVGSVALEDFQPGRSDIDFVAAVAEPLREDELAALAEAHEELSRQRPKPWFSGVYVTWDQLAADPRGEAVPFHLEGRFRPTGGFDANLVQWLTLRTNPVVVRGPSSPEVWADPAAVRAWTLDNLNSYWRTWVAVHRRLVGRGAWALSDRGVAWGVLGVPRLHFTLSTGRVTSKTGAGEYARSTFDSRWEPIVNEAVRIRRGGEGPGTYRRRRLARRRDALDFMAHVIEDANTRLA